ncbi:FCD domain-containing protein [Aurantimonas sp. Leaf443]|uniref:FadR/GntR family transcriptional regulator n=1 Tax=Aurantimonas sp. Leaf443 TaxID=1736378 RepID=UPI0006F48BB9|nr:FCD domain-containing protein [Aurantimonas sp. Leaf443]KQT83035.1 hypothetical protein ASG48_13700 [Aurantimonas sp. Leaf443]
MASPTLVLDHAPDLHERIVRRNVREVVAGKIASLIDSGLLKIGDDLPGERDLAAAFQVSRETVRGGIQILAAKGLLTVVHGARTRIASSAVGSEFRRPREAHRVDVYTLDEIHAARLLVERAVVGEAATRIEAGTIAFLRECVRAQRAVADDPLRFLISDREFHLAVYRLATNRALVDFTVDLYGFVIDSRRLAVAEPGVVARSIADHEAIVDALERRDREATIRAFEIHIEHIGETTRAMLARAGPP